MTRGNYLIRLQTYFLVAIFLITPFFNILKYKIGNENSYLIISFFIFFLVFLALLSNKVRTDFNEKKLILPSLIVMVFCLSVIFHSINDGNTHKFFILYYGSSFFVFFLFYACHLNRFIDRYLLVILKASFVFFSIIVIIDFFLIFLELTDKQLLYGTKASIRADGIVKHNNILRPLGAFGQASVNGTIIIFTYFFMMAVDKKNSIFGAEKVFYLILLMASMILQGSGVAFFALFISLLLVFFTPRMFFYFISATVLTVFISYELDLFLYTRLDIEYILEISLIFYNEIIELFFRFDNIGELLFGTGGVKASTDFQELMAAKFIYQMGLLPFVLYCIWFALLLYKSPNNYYRAAILISIIGSQHYEAMFRGYSMIFYLALIYNLILLDGRRKLISK